MAKRNNIIIVPTPEVQGEDSWIKVRALTVEEYNRTQRIPDEIRKAQEAGDLERIAELEKESWADTASVLLDWNWVDDEGKPLPNPHDNPDVFKHLTMHEIFAIGEAMNPYSQQQKKTETRSAISS